MATILEDPATWFLIWGIIIIVATIIYWAITQVTGAAFWILIIVGIIVILWGIIGLFFNHRSMKKSKPSSDSQLY